MAEKVFFLHGGPGMNGQGERRLLLPHVESRGFQGLVWDEPSPLRGDMKPEELNNFEYLLDSALESLQRHSTEQPVWVVAHSFGCHAALNSLNKLSHKDVAGLVLVAPATDFIGTAQAIARLAMADFRESEPQKAEELSKLLGEMRRPGDGRCMDVFRLALEDPQLFSHYWQCRDTFTNWLSGMSEPQYGLDLDTFWLVMEQVDLDYQQRLQQTPLNGFPVHLVFGELDPIISMEKECQRLAGFVGDYSVHTMAGRGHFPHLEKPQAFLDLFLS